MAGLVIAERRLLPLLKVSSMLGVATPGTSCGSPLLPDRDPGLVGVIVAVGSGLWGGTGDGPMQIHVKAHLQDECGIIFTLDDASLIVDSRGAQPKRATAEMLTEGALVAVWFDAVLDSCPGQSWPEVVERRG